MIGELFQNVTAVIPAGSPLVSGGTTQSDTAVIVAGMTVQEQPPRGTHFVCIASGGKVLTVDAQYIRMNLSEPMKKALAEVVLTQ